MMPFKSAESELSFIDVIELFSKFKSSDNNHVQSISNPQGGDLFWVLNTDPKKKGNYSNKIFCVVFKNLIIKL